MWGALNLFVHISVRLLLTLSVWFILWAYFSFLVDPKWYQVFPVLNRENQSPEENKYFYQIENQAMVFMYARRSTFIQLTLFK